MGQSGADLVAHFKEVFMEPTVFMDRILDIYKKGEPVFGEIIRMKDGRLLSRDHTPIKQDGQIVAHVWVYQEIISRLANEELDIQRVLNRFISTLYEQETEEEILWEVARNCIAYLDFHDCVIYMLDEKKGVLQQRAAWGPKAPSGKQIEDYMELPLGVGIVGSVAQSGKAKVIEDVTTDLRYVSGKFSGLSEITVPILSKGKVIGVIDSEHPQKSFFTNKHLSILTTLAAVVGIKITQIRERQVRQTEIENQRLFYEQILNNIPALSKPFDAAQLMGVLVRNLGAQTEGLQTQHDKGKVLASELTIDLTYLNRVGNGNPAFMKTMLKSFIESVDEITIEMEQMLAKGDRKSIGEAAHKLKFALGVVGVTALKNDVAFLEDQGKGYSEAAVDQEYTRVASGFIRNLRGLREEAGSKV